MIEIHSNLISTSQNAFTLEDKSKFGEKKQGKIYYTKYEAVYLIENKKAESKKKIKLNTKEQINYLIFQNLRKKGYIVKTGLKFGTEFRVYKKKSKHADWLVHPINQSKLDLKELTSKNRVAHSTGKKLLLALIDSQKDITYFEINWLKP